MKKLNQDIKQWKAHFINYESGYYEAKHQKFLPKFPIKEEKVKMWMEWSPVKDKCSTDQKLDQLNIIESTQDCFPNTQIPFLMLNYFLKNQNLIGLLYQGIFKI